ncbi:DUF4412 domain-containing protein [Tellurirhabdus bombi]|uniref:DUF4412 domain-containing protein n=1 Tax=Tellurirhabdus bombi TaxID=2907205 RepID=UPI001F48ADF2|nr:DUF4412 domain-containing protein [Tellurirhabdus bombi]
MKKISFLLIALLLAPFVQAQQGSVEYKISMKSGNQNINSSSVMYFSNGNVRTEMSIPLPGAPKPIKQTMLLLTSKPNTVYLLNEATKTYTENATNTASKTNPGKITVKVLGKEKIQNMNCTHAVVTTDKGNVEVWTTKEIPGYEKLISYWSSSKNFGVDNMYSELKKNDAEGFFVRMQNNAAPGGMVMDLVRYDTKAIPASQFEIPKDFKKGMSYDPEKMKNMSPAERQKAVEEMMKQYGLKQ